MTPEIKNIKNDKTIYLGQAIIPLWITGYFMAYFQIVINLILKEVIGNLSILKP